MGAGRLIDPDRGGRSAVEATIAVLCFRAHFDAGNVAHSDNRAVGIGAQDDRGEFLRLSQATFGLDVDLDLLLACDRSGANATERRLNILVLNGLDYVVWREVDFFQSVGMEPNTQ